MRLPSADFEFPPLRKQRTYHMIRAITLDCDGSPKTSIHKGFEDIAALRSQTVANGRGCR
jgi:hypothetical protein